jgi:hypothetical protein
MFMEINQHNQYSEVFDVNLFNHPEHLEIRMLYTCELLLRRHRSISSSYSSSSFLRSSVFGFGHFVY